MSTSSYSGSFTGGSPPSSSGSAPSSTADIGADLLADAKKRVGMMLKGKWRLDELLGVGGMAAVYAATHRNGNRAALKILHPEFAREEAVRNRFVREGYVANRVDHPGRVAILDDDQTDEGAPFLVMELLRGRTLQQHLKRVGKMPVIEALRMAADVLDTLVPFHEQKIVHRDLKPGNIFLAEEGPIKLLDFGVAQLRETGSEATRAGTAFGTPSFMAPEQAMGKTDTLDARADLFAIGATLYAALGGRRLWHGKSSNESYILAATQPAPSLARVAPDLPVEVIALVDKALQWDRRNRFQDAAEMCDAIHRLIAKLELGEDEPPPAAGAETSPPGRRAHPAARRPGVPAAGPPSALPRPPPLPTAGAAAEPRISLGPSTASRTTLTGGLSRPPPSGREAATAAGPLRTSLAPGERSVPTTLEWDGIKLEDVFKRLDRLLKAIRHYGLGHPEAASKVHGVHEAIISVLRADPEALCWEIQPYCFTREGEPLWEPEAPADVIPYNLYASGLKRMQLLPGLPEDELRKLCELISLDPGGDGGVADIAGALWDAGLTRVALEITDDLTGFDATEEESFWAEADDVEALVRDDLGACAEQAGEAGEAAYAEAVAMVLDPQAMLAREDVAEAVAMAMGVEGRSRGYGSGADALRLDPASSATLLGELRQPAERWRERFLDLAMDAMADAAWRGDEPLVWAPFGTQARRLVRTGEIDAVFALYDGLFERLGPFQQQAEFAVSLRGLTSEMFHGRVLEAVTKLAAGVEAGPVSLDLGGKPSAELRERALRTLRMVTGLLDGQHCGDGLTIADQIPEGEPLELLLGWLGNHVLGNEAFFAEQIHRLSPRLAHRVLSMLHAAGSEEALGVLRPLRTSANPSLRCEAMALLAESHEVLKDQLLDMIDGLDVTLRAAALSTMVRHQVRAVGPGLIRMIESPGFRDRPLDVQGEILRALHELHPRRADNMLCAIVRQHGLMKDDTLDRTRMLAAELLGEWGDTAEIVAALDEALARRWWNSAELRETARTATERVTARLAATGAGGGRGRRDQYGSRSDGAELGPAAADATRGSADQLAAAVITAIHRLAKQATLYEDENETRVRQLQLTQEAVRTYGARTGRNFSAFWLQQSVFIGRRLLRAGRAVYAAALELAELLRPLGIAQIVVGFDVPMEELRQLQEVFRALQRRMKPAVELLSFSRIRLRRSPDLDKRFVDEHNLSPRELSARCYAKAVVVMRRLFEDLQQGKSTLPIRVRRASQQLVDVCSSAPSELVALAVLHNARGDDASRAVNTAIVAAMMARELGADPRVLARIATATLLCDVGKPRVAGVDPTGEARTGGIMPRLGEEQYAELPAATAALMTMLEGVSDAGMTHTALAYEALHLQYADRLEPAYGGLRQPTVAGRIVAMARRFAELNSEPDLDPPRTVAEIMTILQLGAVDPADLGIFRLLASVLQIYPTGVVVELSTGEIAQVLHTPTDPASFSKPVVGVLVDARGQRLLRPRELHLAQLGSSSGPIEVVRVLALPDESELRAALESHEATRQLAGAEQAPEREDATVNDEEVELVDEPAPARDARRGSPERAAAARRSVPPAESRGPSTLPSPDAEPAAIRSPAQAAPRASTRPPAPRASTRPPAPRASTRPPAPRASTRPLAPRASTRPPAPRASTRPPAPRASTRPPAPRASTRPPAPRASAAPAAARRSTAPAAARRSTTPAPARRSTAPTTGGTQSPTQSPTPPAAASQPRAAPAMRKRALVPPSVPLDAEGTPIAPTAEGTLSDAPLMDLVLYLAQHHFTGSLDLVGPAGERFVLYFDRGRPAKAYSKTQVAPLDRVLVEMKLVDFERLQQSIQVIAKTGQLHGEQLIAEGAINRYQLLEALRLQVVHKARAMFLLPPQTRYAVYADVSLLADYGGPELTPSDPLRVVMAGVRARPHALEVGAVVGQLGPFPFGINPAANIDGLGLMDEEQRVELLLRERPRTLAELNSTPGLTPAVVRITLYALTLAGALTFADEAGGSG